MTQYVETFHQVSGVYALDVVPMPAITPQWGSSSVLTALQEVALTSKSPHDLNDLRRLLLTSPGSGKGIGASLARVTNFADGSVASSVLTNHFSRGVAVRASGTGASPTCYVVQPEPSGSPSGSVITLRLRKVVAGVFTLLGSSSAKSLAEYPSTTLPGFYFTHLMLEAVGTTIRAKAWPLGTPEPTAWDVSVTDSSIVGAGWAGLVSMDVSSFANVSGGYLSVSNSSAQRPYIPVSHYERMRFLEESSNVANLLFEVGVLGSSDGGTTGVASTVCLSTRGFVTAAGDVPASTVYDGLIDTVGDFRQTISDDLLGHASQGFGDVTVVNENGKLDDWLRWNWDGRSFRILAGSKNWRLCDYVLVTRGSVEQVQAPAVGQLAFKLRDSSNVLNRKLVRPLVGGSGPDAAKPVPLVLGDVFNVTPTLVDATTHRYKLTPSTYSGLTSIGDVREGGASILGSVTNDLPNGEFLLAASPAYGITVDCLAALSSALHTTMWTKLLENYSELVRAQIYPSTGAAFGHAFLGGDTGPATTIGLFVSQNEEPSVISLLDMIASSGRSVITWNRWGEVLPKSIDLTETYGGFPAVDFTLQEDDLDERGLCPVGLIVPAEFGRKVLYKRNWTKQDANALTGSVTETNRAIYSSDGTVAAVPNGSTATLDNPTQHVLKRQRTIWETLWKTYDTLFSVRDRDSYASAVGLFEFSTRKNAMEFEIATGIDMVHSKYGFENGVRAWVTKLSRNPRTRRGVFTVAIKLTGFWPATTTGYPYVGEGDFE